MIKVIAILHWKTSHAVFSIRNELFAQNCQKPYVYQETNVSSQLLVISLIFILNTAKSLE